MSTGLSTERLQRIDRFFQEKYIDTGKLPGAQILVARHGEIAHFSSLGKMDVEHDKPTVDDTIGSVRTQRRGRITSFLIC
jgi:CubicO group peptidase (beta-lactamase class C family)